MSRNLSIDALKAFAIFLVVLGHFLQSTIPDFDNNHLFRLIYSFHMPLFIFISGYLSYRYGGIQSAFLNRRFLSLLIPFFSWMLISSIINYFENDENIVSFVLRVLLFPDNGLWYLWVLFWMQSVLFLSNYLSRKYTEFLLGVFCLLILIIVYIFKIDNIFAIKTFASLFSYFILGYIASNYKNSSNVIFKRWYVALPFFLFLAYFWKRNDVLNFDSYVVSSKLLIFFYKNSVAIIAIIVFMGLFNHIKKYSNYVLYLGKNSIAVYAMNFYCLLALRPLISFISDSYFYYFYALLFSVIIVLTCLFFGNILKKNKFSALFFLGNY
jgi:fucose 4-O-acetylase-like acetyltransferase